jgi:hypothetical protein
VAHCHPAPSLRALGVATPTEIRDPFIRWKYVNPPASLEKG